MSNQEEYFTYLDELRESGVTPIRRASAYLERDFGLNKYEARNVMKDWMEHCRKEPAA
ncbi:MAG: hypothetical protein QGF09_04720 [Rhodospirillales bacterium]|jgi:hypothetical protein|nr:hypothetical protein [Rhodospirillales bacterium]